MIQQKTFAVILGNDYQNYEAALLLLKQDRLDSRRTNLSHNFATKCTQSPMHSSLFPPNSNYRVEFNQYPV